MSTQPQQKHPTLVNQNLVQHLKRKAIELKSPPQPSVNAQIAAQWRKDNGYAGKGGVVIIYDGVVDGWSNELRDPQSWQPGCFAIDESGNEWQTVGGNYYNGAKSWERVSMTTLQDELKLISVCQEIGGIAKRNNQYTLSLTLHINQPVESLTVSQLLSFHRECVQRFNQGVNHV
ncbi:MAG: hypothetical protein KZQ64_07295 [gamma proteobacterium symbiont of Bathyaustriella thionipta]|nr:hypothetical protein [gamma proteobacterium symbiont of Bathyaustriella thionipta]MCU7951357.1 hypothetical protein [gamma proteobacterium symbiont of Bathyaustriella thionipta]MCU7953177.1 hypothetical protein [gamma proteobacterium symbiont of Bathyaustriella thionipta]MCU7957911.1 hypothetical protein [gamma proteobacterium symbiont of Bathyaustriella thionipta]MCU7965968.1 hypothetical protein [gamma proteobacterium symbiont of Bathyaustriella thionipta]